MAEDLPRLPRAKPPREIEYDVPILFSGERTLLRRRRETMLQGLWCFPLIEGHRTGEGLRAYLAKHMALNVASLTEAGPARHVFSHQVWRMNLFTGETASDARAPEEYEWVPLSEVEELPFPTAMKAARKILQGPKNR